MHSPQFPQSLHLSLPDWIGPFSQKLPQTFPDAESRMAFAIELAAENVRQGTGGPFGAAVFDSHSGELVAIGVNRVLPLHNSTAHAEMMALMLAEKKLGLHRLDENGGHYTLATSAQPCAMCYGAIPWAGIRCLLIGASKADVESLTDFDEGPLPDYWRESLRKRGVDLVTDLLRTEACAVLRQFSAAQGETY